MAEVALGIAKRWKWDKSKAKKLFNDLQAYNQSAAPFAGGQADGLLWWKNLPVNAEAYPLKAFSMTILSIVGICANIRYQCQKSGGDWEVHVAPSCTYAH
jgi:hypothetical protein